MDELVKNKRHINICILIVCIVFLLCIIFGYQLALRDTKSVERILEQVLSGFARIRNMNIFMIFLFIFLNNAIKGFFVLVLGMFFGIIPLLFIFLNGELIGIVLGISQIKGLGISRIIVGIIPHGILEIPAIMLSAGYGLWLGYRFYRFIWHKDDFGIYFSFALRKYFKVILPLLLLAALIEAFVTPYVIKLF